MIARRSLLLSAAAAAACFAMPALGQAPAADARAFLPPGAPVIQLSGAQLGLILKTLDEAEAHGFDKGEFGPADLSQRFASTDPATRARAAALVGPAIVRYAQAQRGQRLQGRFIDDWGIRPEPYDAGAAFAQAVSSDKIAEWLASLPPPYEGYRQLKVALAAYKGLAGKGGWSPIADGPSLKVGMTDPRVSALRQRLAWEDPQTPQAAAGADPNRMDQPLADALARFQALHGLKPDGVLGKDAMGELNIPTDQRVAMIEANLERWRWLPRAAAATRIEVNIASQEVQYYEDGKLAETMKAVAGKKTTPTPMLISQIHSLVLNPPWNVPTSIATKELWPKERANPGYLSRENFVVRDGGGLQQRPGPDNSLGRIKFDFANKYGVYLHDTPGHAAFSRDMRNLSHGCVRLERPIDLAKRLLADGGEIAPDGVDQVLLGDETTRAKLAKPVSVYLFYWTVFVDDTAKLNWRPDVYNWDATVMGRLDAGQSRT